MITTVFAFGQYDEEKHQDAIVGKDERQQYSIAVGLLITVVLFIPIMLCFKPCVVLCSSKPDEEKQEIEMMMSGGDLEPSDMGAGDQMNEGGSYSEESELMMEGGSALMDEDKDGKGLVAKREGELKSLDQ